MLEGTPKRNVGFKTWLMMAINVNPIGHRSRGRNEGQQIQEEMTGGSLKVDVKMTLRPLIKSMAEIHSVHCSSV